ncbi:DUF4957 domain-containing protein [Flavobacterium agrisoli]|uniref:DUF4957 domain-containing protein n=1 Tax=Flavobacterium agrisoli TaxID=2793066 RepID=A0A934PL65_9FLAO|nr:DUF4957 domain-containing protein [Flavobacterium agrisoli]MBK0370196.1 DUF4957 domain-containing protein [Flavobacterium agrisoli]
MKNNYQFLNYNNFILAVFTLLLVVACNSSDDEVFEKTRLFGPVLNEDLHSEKNTIIVDIAKFKDAVAYTVEVSRDTFKTIEYTIQSDTNYVVINKQTVGQELFWNMLYQVRAKAHADDPAYDSNVSDFGSVRTQVFESILNSPSPYDVTDIAARVTWLPIGTAVTGIKVFAADDFRLENPLFPERAVTAQENQNGEAIVEGLSASTTYQIAIYSGEELRGWVNFTTRTPDLDPNAAGVIDLRNDENPNAVANALSTAPNNAIILVKRGITYNAPSVAIDKSVTIQAAYGFGEERAKLIFAGNFDVANGANVGHLRFVGLELRGTDWGGKYVMNMGQVSTLDEMSFEDCYITNFRGILRQKDKANVLNNYIINNCVIDSINGYGIVTVDNAAAKLNNMKLTNTSVNHSISVITSRNNFQSLLISDCSMANTPDTGATLINFRQSGQNNVANGINITNCIFGHSWDRATPDTFGIVGIAGLEQTSFQLLNNYTTKNFFFTKAEIPGFPIANYTNTQNDLWVDVSKNNFYIKDKGFNGKYDAGDPKFRDKL